MARVLLVEDDPPVLRTLERMLKSDGHEVYAVGEMPSALQVLEAQPVDVVITDLMLPGASGVELLRFLQDHHPHLPAIVITGEPTLESAVEAVRTRAFEYLSKPVSRSQLSRAVARAARLKHLEDERQRLEAANRAYQENLEELVAQRTLALQESEARLRQSEQQLHALAARLIHVREAERAQMAREIHDELGQLLTGLKMDLHWLLRQCQCPPEKRSYEAIASRLQDALAIADDTIKCVQRLSAELRPSALDKLGLGAALRQELRQFGERSGLAVSLRLPEEEPALPAEQALALFRIVQEALTNVARHAQATAVTVTLEETKGGWELRVTDNGRGIREEETQRPQSLGLLGMKERVLPWRGTVSFERPAGGGTCVRVFLPRPAAGASGDSP
ncbi:response regulator [Fontisphaera persica]|uniref:hybrid sensor histidine kinase/response regulator n=1 Tax=Fontisphaera persica TaxID=2974023 RepID=UPI0024BF22B3|nr:response regulator [Fontisphaera persica]WCJ58948.1 response regulator [Fontisphaera persica]